MPKSLSKFLTLTILIGVMVQWSNDLIVSPVRAYDLTETETVSVTATVPNTVPTTTDTTAPTNPILVSPTDGTVTRDNRPEFIWRVSTDNNSNTVVYTLYRDGVATYLGISGLGNSSGSGYTARVDNGEIHLSPTSSLSDGSYNWYVTASDLSGNTSYSTTWHFTIDTTAPHIFVTDIDIYHNLLLDSDNLDNFGEPNFDISGPKDVYFTIHSEPWSTITLQFFDSDNQLLKQTPYPVNNTGVIYPYEHLDIGVYRVSISAFDHGGNTTVLPDIILSITQAQVSLALPGIPGLPPAISIPYTPFTLSSLPATVANISTRVSLTSLISILLAIVILVLLIIVWKHKYNLVLLDSHMRPITTATIYHSIPTSRLPHSPIFTTKREPISYELISSDHGKLYIPHLNRYSTFTVRLDNVTYILSLSVKRSLYTIVLG